MLLHRGILNWSERRAFLPCLVLPAGWRTLTLTRYSCMHIWLADRNLQTRQSEALDRLTAHPQQGKNLRFVANLRGQTLAAEDCAHTTQITSLLTGLDTGGFAALFAQVQSCSHWTSLAHRSRRQEGTAQPSTITGSHATALHMGVGSTHFIFPVLQYCQLSATNLPSNPLQQLQLNINIHEYEVPQEECRKDPRERQRDLWNSCHWKFTQFLCLHRGRRKNKAICGMFELIMG